jgi:hypothetical protein
LVARLNAWQDNDRKLEKSYKRNRKNEKYDMFCICPAAMLIVANYVFDYIDLKMDSINLLIVLFSACFLGYTVYSAVRSYHVINTMEDKLGVGRRKFTQ